LRTIKQTQSLCPTCLKVVDATLYEEDGQVLIRKQCEQHGFFEDVYWSDYEQYVRAQRYEHVGSGIENPRTKSEKGCPYDCGICPNHTSTTILAIVDVTNRCNLRCPVCFAHAGAAGYVYEPTKEEIFRILENLRQTLPVPPKAIQFSGGEPTLRKDLPELITYAKKIGFNHVEVDSNGIRFAENIEYIKELMQAGMDTVYLQFDGVTPEPYHFTRGCNLFPTKLKALENFRKAGLRSVVLVPTLVKGVNDHQVGEIIRFGAKNFDIVRAVNFQPVSITGRIDRSKLREMRITIPDFMRLCEEQTKGEIKVSDFFPVPTVVPISRAVGALKGSCFPELTAHPHCGAATFVFVQKDKIIPVTRYANIDGFMKTLEKTYEDAKNGAKIKAKMRLISSLRHVKLSLLRELVSTILTTGTFESLARFTYKTILIGCMHFMDPYNFDLERVQRCCIHYGVPGGRIIPFCTMNSIHRPTIEKDLSISIEEWKSKNPGKSVASVA
jgi:uncharacterized radical SAM superfamily Fe-S cluster-containing enzyme